MSTARYIICHTIAEASKQPFKIEMYYPLRFSSMFDAASVTPIINIKVAAAPN